MDVCIIREFIDSGKFVVNLGCRYEPHLLVSSFIQNEMRGRDKVVGARGEYNFIKVHKNLVQHPSNNISFVM